MKKIFTISLILVAFAATVWAQKDDDSKKNRKDKTIVVEIFQKVDRAPEFPGGEEKLQEFITENQKFPDVGSENEFDETVHLLCLMKADGSIDQSTIKVEESINDVFDAEAIRLLKAMPKWTPAYSSVVEKEVDVWLKVPIRFVKTVTYN